MKLTPILPSRLCPMWECYPEPGLTVKYVLFSPCLPRSEMLPPARFDRQVRAALTLFVQSGSVFHSTIDRELNRATLLYHCCPVQAHVAHISL